MSVDNCLQEVINRPEDDFRELRTGQPFLYKNIQLLYLSSTSTATVQRFKVRHYTFSSVAQR